MELDLIRYRTADVNLPFQRCCLNEGKRGNGIATETERSTEKRKKRREITVNVTLPAGSPTLLVFLKLG